MTVPVFSHGGNVHAAVRQSGHPLQALCDFSASINPLGFPTSARKALEQSLSLIPHYPDPQGYELVSALARQHRLNPGSIVLGNGSIELIYALPSALTIRHALIVGPTFTEYERALQIAGGSCSYLLADPANGYLPPLDRVSAFLRKQWKTFRSFPNGGHRILSPVDAVFLCNPNNPTGRVLPRKAVLNLLGIARDRGVRLIVDEAFIEFCMTHSVLRDIPRQPGLLVLRSFTKFFAMPGLRIGYAVGSCEDMEKIRSRVPPWSVNVLAQQAAQAALGDHQYWNRSLIFMENERPRFIRELRNLPGFRVVPSHANFVLVELPKGCQAVQLEGLLKSRGFLVRNCDSFIGVGRQSLRLAIRRPKENRGFIAALKGILEKRLL